MKYSNSEKIADSYLENEKKNLHKFSAFPFKNPFEEEIEAVERIEDHYECLCACVKLQDKMQAFFDGEGLALRFAEYFCETEELPIRDARVLNEHHELYNGTLFPVEVMEFFDIFHASTDGIPELWKQFTREFEYELGPKHFSDEAICKIKEYEEKFYRNLYCYCEATYNHISNLAKHLSTSEQRKWIAEGAWECISEKENSDKLAGFLMLLRETIDLNNGSLLTNSVVWECIEDYEQLLTPVQKPEKVRTVSTEKVTYVKADFFECIKKPHFNETALAYAGLLSGYSFEGQDLSQASTEKLTFLKCNLRNTNAVISLENCPEIYFVAGRPVDYTNLCDCIFQGCRVTGFNPEEYVFSVDTFDMEFLRQNHASYFVDETKVPREVIDGIYRKESVSSQTLLKYQQYLTGTLMKRAMQTSNEHFSLNYCEWQDLIEKEKAK